MRLALRHALFATVLASFVVLGSCADDKPDAAHGASGALPRPGLPRPPTGGLPAELRPPR